MRMKKLIASLLIGALAVSTLAGCGSKTETGGDGSGSGSGSGSASGGGSAAAETMVIEVYDVAANYQGTQTGWFGQVVKDKFGIELNIIAPQVAGDAVFQTRASTGNLGDLLLLESGDFADCVEAGLVKDITADIGKYSNLMTYKEQIDVFNNGLKGNDSKATYGIPTEMTNTSPTSYSQDVIYSSPLLRWDLYTGVGSPDIKDLDGLLDVLEDMKEKYPTNADGDAAYPFSLWADWDGGDGMLGIANVVQLTTWYGEKIKGSVILKPDETFTTITDKNASYYKILKFLNDAYQRGLVDPDSGTQDWNAACAKMSAGQVYLMWYSWQVGFWNTQDRLTDGSAFIFIPVEDQQYYADSDSYYGSGRVFAVGSKVDDAKYAKIMEFLDWYASPEGCVYQHSGIENFNYSVGADGKFTIMNDNALMDNLPVPAEYGGGGYSDGNNAINQWIVSSYSTNPNTGETYASQYWSSYKAATMTQMKKDWAAKFGAAEPVDWMKANNKLLVSPNVSVSLPTDSADIAVIRNQCNTTLCDYSWKMIFAKDDAEFDKIWDEMTVQLEGFDYNELVKFDTEKHTIELQAKQAAK